MTEDQSRRLALFQQQIWPISTQYFSLGIFWYIATRHAFCSAPSFPDAGTLSGTAIALTGREQRWAFALAGGVKQLTHRPYTALARAPCPGCPGLGTFRCWPPSLPVSTLTAVWKAACCFFLWVGWQTTHYSFLEGKEMSTTTLSRRTSILENLYQTTDICPVPVLRTWTSSDTPLSYSSVCARRGIRPRGFSLCCF